MQYILWAGRKPRPFRVPDSGGATVERVFSGFSLGVSAVVVKNGELLLVHRMYEPNKAKWTVPGGYVNRGETAEAAASRELLEETGVRATVKSVVGIRDRISPSDNNMLIIFLMDEPEGEPQPDMTEVDDARYFSRAEIASSPDMIQLTRLMAERVDIFERSGFDPVPCESTPLIQCSYYGLYLPG